MIGGPTGNPGRDRHRTACLATALWTVLASEEAVAGELLAAHHDEFVMLSSILRAAASSLSRAPQVARRMPGRVAQNVLLCAAVIPQRLPSEARAYRRLRARAVAEMDDRA
jgi:hypothetical protein